MEDPRRRRIALIGGRRAAVAVEDRHPALARGHHHGPIPGLVSTLEAEHLGVEAARAVDVRDPDRDVVEPLIAVPRHRSPRLALVGDRRQAP